jgi:predicted dehydrogenase
MKQRFVYKTTIRQSTFTFIGKMPDYTPTIPDPAYPILIIGTGGIVKDAHLPAYKLAKLPVWGLYNRTLGRAKELADEYGIEHVYDDLDEAIAAAPANTIFDIALPASLFADALRRLPEGAHVLIQKPMGETFAEAREILDVCRERRLQAAINCQLRYAPFVVAARKLIGEGTIGELVDMEMRLTVYTPWHLFPFLEGLPRMEMLYHSVHYVDLVRSFLGEPRSVSARTVPHPDKPGLASVSSTIILDYPNPLRVGISTNHSHNFGPKHQESYLKWEGTKGAIKARIGLLMDYPRGVGDTFEVCIPEAGKEPEWRAMDIEGSWFPEAFIGTMGEVQRHKADREAGRPAAPMPCDVEDVIKTMACLEAAYESDRVGGIKPEQWL